MREMKPLAQTQNKPAKLNIQIDDKMIYKKCPLTLVPMKSSSIESIGNLIQFSKLGFSPTTSVNTSKCKL